MLTPETPLPCLPTPWLPPGLKGRVGRGQEHFCLFLFGLALLPLCADLALDVRQDLLTRPFSFKNKTLNINNNVQPLCTAPIADSVGTPQSREQSERRRAKATHLFS